MHVSVIFPLAGKIKWWQIVLTVIAAVLCIFGILLWIVVGVVVPNPLNSSKLLHFSAM